MGDAFVQQEAVRRLLREGAGLNVPGGNERFKAIVHRLLENICTLIGDYNVMEEELWHAVNYLHELGGRQGAALLATGLGLEHFLDLRQDAVGAAARRETDTPRTIRGPLHVANAPLADSHTRIDDGTNAGEVMWLHGRVKDNQDRPIADAIVDIWHANTLGNYSFFDQSQSDYNLRCRIRTGADGRYSVHSIMSSGCGCPPDGLTRKLLDQLGRHGNRSAHIHFFVSAPSHKHLTSQISLGGDKYLWDDFVFATRDGLITDPVRVTGRETIVQRDLEGEHTGACFDFTLCKALNANEEYRGTRLYAKGQSVLSAPDTPLPGPGIAPENNKFASFLSS